MLFQPVKLTLSLVAPFTDFSKPTIVLGLCRSTPALTVGYRRAVKGNETDVVSARLKVPLEINAFAIPGQYSRSSPVLSRWLSEPWRVPEGGEWRLKGRRGGGNRSSRNGD